MTWVDNSRILASFAVVLLHVIASTVLGFDSPDRHYWWVGIFYSTLTKWSVPVFVMVSGALLLDSSKNESILEFYKKRAVRIVAPLFFWSVIWAIFDSYVEGETPFLYSCLVRILSGTPHAHMWFLYMIAGLYLATPFLRKITHHSTKRELRMLVIGLFVASSISYAYGILYAGHTKLFLNWFLFYLPYFLGGHLIRETSWRPTTLLLVSSFVLFAVASATGCYLVAERAGLSKGLYFLKDLSITVIPMSISIMFLLKGMTRPLLGKERTGRIARLTLGIYVFHPMALQILYHCGITVDMFNPAFSAPATAILAFVLSLGTAHLIHSIPYLKRVI